MMEKNAELQSVKKELITLLDAAKNIRVKNLLQTEINKVDAELQEWSLKQVNNKDEVPKTAARTVVDIKEHAFDESDKYVKLFIPFDATNLKDEDVELNLSEDSLALVINTDKKSHQFKATSLLKKINCEKSYKKIKSDMVSVYLKKVKEGETWGCLTSTEKKLKDSKAKAFDKNEDEDMNDPNAALMNIMKKMYETGDPEMKRTIAKAWTEGQNKQKEFPM